MPLITLDEAIADNLAPPKELEPRAPHVDTPNIAQKIGAAFSLNNPIVSALAGGRPGFTYDPVEGFDPLQKARPDQPHDPIANPYVHIAPFDGDPQAVKAFVGAQSPEHVEQIKRNIQRENDARNTLANSGFSGMALSMAAGALDPLLILGPEAAIFKVGKEISIARTALSYAKQGAVLAALQESALHATQSTRTLEESATNFAGATVLSGVLGGAIGSLVKPAYSKMASDIEKFTGKTVDIQKKDPLVFGVSGASEAGPPKVADGAIPPELAKAAMAPEVAPSLGFAHIAKWISPRLQGFMSESPIMRTITNKLLMAPMRTVGEPNVAPVEAAVDAWFARYTHAMTRLDDHYARFRSGGEQAKASTFQRVAGFSKTPDVISRAEFGEQVAAAIRRIGTDEMGGFHPDVQAAAKDMANNVIRPIAQRAVDVGLLPQEVIDKPGYLTRLYDTETLRNGSPLRGTNGAQEREAFANAVAQAIINKAESDGGKVPSYPKALTSARKAVDTILEIEIGRVSPANPRLRGPFIERTLNVPDQAIERWLINDPQRVLSYYTRTVAADAEIAARLGLNRFKKALEESASEVVGKLRTPPEASLDGAKPAEAVKPNDILRERYAKTFKGIDSDLLKRKSTGGLSKLVKAIREAETDEEAVKVLMSRDHRLLDTFMGGNMELPIDQVRTAYARQMKADPGKAKELSKQADRDIANLRLYRDEIRGLNRIGDPTSLPSRFARQLRQWAFMAMGGNIAISSMTDLALAPFNYGFGTVLRAQSEAWFRESSDVVRGMAREDAKHALRASELALNLHNQRLFDTEAYPVRNLTRFEGVMDKLSHGFSVVSGIAPQFEAMKQFVGLVVNQFVIENAVKVVEGAKLPKGTLARLEELGLDEAMLKRIGEQWRKHGEEDGFRSTIAPNGQAWSDKEALEAFRGAQVKAQRTNMIQGSALDRPNIPGLGGELSRLVFQFMNYGFATNTRVLGRAIQYRDGQAVMGALSMIGLSGLIVALRDKIEGREDRDFKNWAYESVKQSPVAGSVFDFDRYLSMLSNNTIGVSPFFADKGRTRYYTSQDMAAAILGPGTGLLLRNVLPAVKDVATMNVDEKTVSHVRRSLILNNVFLWRRLFDQLEETVKNHVPARAP